MPGGDVNHGHCHHNHSARSKSVRQNPSCPAPPAPPVASCCCLGNHVKIKQPPSTAGLAVNRGAWRGAAQREKRFLGGGKSPPKKKPPKKHAARQVLTSSPDQEPSQASNACVVVPREKWRHHVGATAPAAPAWLLARSAPPAWPRSLARALALGRPQPRVLRRSSQLRRLPQPRSSPGPSHVFNACRAWRSDPDRSVHHHAVADCELPPPCVSSPVGVAVKYLTRPVPNHCSRPHTEQHRHTHAHIAHAMQLPSDKAATALATRTGHSWQPLLAAPLGPVPLPARCAR
jgi:hypothetical protein